jgi:hypothetical protein
MPAKRLLLILAGSALGSINLIPVLLVSIWLSVLFVMTRGNPDFLKIDHCLDDGGRWNYQTRTCEH